MASVAWEEERKEWEKEALAEHGRLSRLFRENRSVLARRLFWDHFHEVWQPIFKQFSSSK